MLARREDTSDGEGGPCHAHIIADRPDPAGTLSAGPDARWWQGHLARLARREPADDSVQSAVARGFSDYARSARVPGPYLLPAANSRRHRPPSAVS